MSFSTSAKEITARKQHECVCYQRYVESGYGKVDIPDIYHDAVDRMKDNRGMINSGDKCLFWSGKFDGEMYSAWADIEMHSLIVDMEWFDE